MGWEFLFFTLAIPTGIWIILMVLIPNLFKLICGCAEALVNLFDCFKFVGNQKENAEQLPSNDQKPQNSTDHYASLGVFET